MCVFIESILTNKVSSNLIYNISDGEPISTKRLIEAIGLAMNKNVRYLFIPDFILNVLFKIPIVSNILKPLFRDFVVNSLHDNIIRNKVNLLPTTELIAKISKPKN